MWGNATEESLWWTCQVFRKFCVSEDVNSEAPSLAISSGTPNVENINLRWDIRPLDPVQSCSARNTTGQWE